jgi:hypothetical protein
VTSSWRGVSTRPILGGLPASNLSTFSLGGPLSSRWISPGLAEKSSWKIVTSPVRNWEIKEGRGEINRQGELQGVAGGRNFPVQSFKVAAHWVETRSKVYIPEGSVDWRGSNSEKSTTLQGFVGGRQKETFDDHLTTLSSGFASGLGHEPPCHSLCKNAHKCRRDLLIAAFRFVSSSHPPNPPNWKITS